MYIFFQVATIPYLLFFVLSLGFYLTFLSVFLSCCLTQDLIFGSEDQVNHIINNTGSTHFRKGNKIFYGDKGDTGGDFVVVVVGGGDGG